MLLPLLLLLLPILRLLLLVDNVHQCLCCVVFLEWIVGVQLLLLTNQCHLRESSLTLTLLDPLYELKRNKFIISFREILTNRVACFVSFYLQITVVAYMRAFHDSYRWTCRARLWKQFRVLDNHHGCFIFCACHKFISRRFCEKNFLFSRRYILVGAVRLVLDRMWILNNAVYNWKMNFFLKILWIIVITKLSIWFAY